MLVMEAETFARGLRTASMSKAAPSPVLTSRLIHSLCGSGFERDIVILCVGGGEDIALALETIV